MRANSGASEDTTKPGMSTRERRRRLEAPRSLLGQGRGVQAGLPGPAVGASSSAGPGELGHLRGSRLVGVSCCHGDLSATDFKVLWPRAAAAPWLESGLRCWRARPRVPVPPLLRCLCLSAPQRGSLPKLLGFPEKNWGCSGLSLGSFSLLRVKGSRKHAGLVSAHLCHPRARPGPLPCSQSLLSAAGRGSLQRACKWVQTPLI